MAILGVGIWIKTDPEISNLGQAVKVGNEEPIIEIITWLFIGSGIFVYAVAVVGFIGTVRGSKIMLGFVSAPFHNMLYVKCRCLICHSEMIAVETTRHHN